MTEIFIILNDSCNMQCSYCFLEKSSREYSLEKILNSISQVYTNNAITFSFYPEPFYNIPRLIEIMEGIYKEFPDSFFKLNTNGFNIQKLNTIIPLTKIQVVLSLDGGEISQSTYRGHFQKIISNFFKYREFYSITKACLTLSEKNVERLTNDILFLWDSGFKNVHVNFNENDRWEKNSLSILREEFEKLYRTYLGEKRYLRNQTTGLFWERELESFNGTKDYCGVCSGTQNYKAGILQDGTLTPCYRLQDYSFGDMTDFTYDTVVDEECKACELLSNCKTCIATSFQKTKINCEFTKLTHEYSSKVKNALRNQEELFMRLVQVEEEEQAAYSLIQNKIACAEKALQIQVIPLEASEEQVHRYLNNVLGILSGYRFLEEDWWRKIKRRYGVSDSKVHYTPETGELRIHQGVLS